MHQRLLSSIITRPPPYWPALEYHCDTSCVEPLFEPTDEASWLRGLGLQVRAGFASQEEQDAMAGELEGVLRKRRWEEGHWDGVITHYRECERLRWESPLARAVVARMKRCFPREWNWRATHVLDLDAPGSIRGHVDSLATVGHVVCGLSLLSPSVMRFDGPEGRAFRCLLEPGTLYIMAGESRHKYAHAILAEEQVFRGRAISKGRRISVMIRDFAVEGHA